MIYKWSQALQGTAKTANYWIFTETPSQKPFETLLCRVSWSLLKNLLERDLELEFARTPPCGTGICADATLWNWNWCGRRPADFEFARMRNSLQIFLRNYRLNYFKVSLRDYLRNYLNNSLRVCCTNSLRNFLKDPLRDSLRHPRLDFSQDCPRRLL